MPGVAELGRNRLGVPELTIIDSGDMVAPPLQPGRFFMKPRAVRGLDRAGEMGARFFVAAFRASQPCFVHRFVGRLSQGFQADHVDAGHNSGFARFARGAP